MQSDLLYLSSGAGIVTNITRDQFTCNCFAPFSQYQIDCTIKVNYKCWEWRRNPCIAAHRFASTNIWFKIVKCATIRIYLIVQLRMKLSWSSNNNKRIHIIARQQPRSRSEAHERVGNVSHWFQDWWLRRGQNSPKCKLLLVCPISSTKIKTSTSSQSAAQRLQNHFVQMQYHLTLSVDHLSDSLKLSGLPE